MPLFCSVTPDGKHRKHVKYLVHDVRHFEENVRRLFELSASCLMEDDPRTQQNKDEEESDAVTMETRDICRSLFSPKSPVLMKGRQTYKMWKATLELSAGIIFKSDLDKPKTLHFFPLEQFPKAVTSGFKLAGFTFIEFLVQFLRLYFPGLNVVLHPLHDISNHDLDLITRYHAKTKKKQFLVTDLYEKLHKSTGTPLHDYIIGFTWTDLYPSEELNFVLGEASSRHRCGVLSFGRHEPTSFEAEELDARGDAEDEDGDDTVTINGELLWKLLRVSTHETSHLFGLNHCVFFECSMNESNSVAQAVSQPLVLCPICLRKIQRFLSFDIKERYCNLLSICKTLHDVYPSTGLEMTIQWLQHCLQFLS